MPEPSSSERARGEVGPSSLGDDEAATEPPDWPARQAPRWVVPPTRPMSSTAVALRLTVTCLVLVLSGAAIAAGALLFADADGGDATRTMSFTLGQGATLRVSLERGSVIAEGAPRSIAEMRAEIENFPHVSYSATQDGDSVLVEGSSDDPLLARLVPAYEPAVDLGAIVEAATVLDLNVESGFVEARGFTGGGRVVAPGGGISVRQSSGDWEIVAGRGRTDVSEIVGVVTVEGDSGAVAIVSVTGDLTVSTHDGDVTARNTGGDVTARTWAGEIVITEVGGNVRASSLTGDIAFSAHLEPGSEHSIASEEGDITVTLLRGADVTITADAPNGRVIVDGHPAATGSFEGALGTGAAHLDLESGSGDIHVIIPLT